MEGGGGGGQSVGASSPLNIQYLNLLEAINIIQLISTIKDSYLSEM